MKAIILLALPLLWAGPLWAANLEEIWAMALAHNPSLQSARQQVQAMDAQAQGADAWGDPMLKLSKSSAPVATMMGSQTQALVLAQPLPFWGEISAKERMGQASLQAAQARLDMAERNLRKRVRGLYYRIQSLEERLPLLKENQALLRQLSELGGREGYQSPMQLGEVFEVEARLGENALEIIAMEEERATLRFELESLLGHRLKLGELAPLESSLAGLAEEEFLRQSLAHSAELAELSAMHEEAQAQAQMADWAQSRPSFELEMAYMQEDSSSEAVNLTLGMNLPFGSTQRTQEQAKTQAQAEAAQAALEAGRLAVEAMAKEVFVQLEQARRSEALFQGTLVPQAAKSLDLTKRLYSAGGGKATEIAMAQGRLLQAKMGLAKAKQEHLQAQAQWLWMLGQ